MKGKPLAPGKYTLRATATAAGRQLGARDEDLHRPRRNRLTEPHPLGFAG